MESASVEKKVKKARKFKSNQSSVDFVIMTKEGEAQDLCCAQVIFPGALV